MSLGLSHEVHVQQCMQSLGPCGFAGRGQRGSGASIGKGCPWTLCSSEDVLPWGAESVFSVPSGGQCILCRKVVSPARQWH